MHDQTHHEACFIDGGWTPPASSKRIDVVGANTGEVIGTVPEGSEADVDRAVAAARRALEGAWGDTTPEQRSAYLERFAAAGFTTGGVTAARRAPLRRETIARTFGGNHVAPC